MVYRYRYKPRRKRKLRVHDILIIVLCIALAVLLYQMLLVPVLQVPSFVVLSGLSTTGYVQVAVDAEVMGGNGIVTLTGGCYQITAYTEAVQAESIANGLAGHVGFRPGTHDLIKDVFENLGIEVLMVKVTELKNNTFFGRLILRQGNSVVSLDARPSDATAIAVRFGAPVYVKESLMKDLGRKIC